MWKRPINFASDAHPRMTRRALIVGLMGAGAMCGIPSSVSASARPRLLRYRASHSVFGNIGTYSNNIDEQGSMTVVRTQIHLLVSVLGVVLHREDADRSERWSGNRLVEFHGVTTANGQASEIWGEARSDGFAVTSAQGTIVAPENVRPSNPWSAGFLDADTMMRTDSGTVERVRISPPMSAAVMISNATIQTREYDISAAPSYKVWLDERDVPVMFAVNDKSGLVSFILTEQT